MNSKVCFSEWANNWLETVKGTVKANTYQATYRNTVVNHLIPEFGDRYLDEIKPYELQQFLNRSSEKYCHDTVKKFKSCLVQIFDEAVYNDFCEKNPCYEDGIKMDGDSIGQMLGQPSEPTMKYTSFRCTSCKKKWIQSQCKLIHDENGIHRFEIQEK